jgi:ADP-ribose pyrophosphatase YjhB (NUDIX family)
VGYVEDLRMIVGHQPLLLTGVGVAVFNSNGEILMQKGVNGKGWGIPGGFMELGESTEEAGRREVFEETGIHIGSLELLTVISGKHTFTKLPNGDEYFSVTIVYVTNEIVGGALQADGIETVDVKFYGINELPESLNPHIMKTIKQYYASNDFENKMDK